MAGRARASRRLAVVRGAGAWTPCLLVVGQRTAVSGFAPTCWTCGGGVKRAAPLLHLLGDRIAAASAAAPRARNAKWMRLLTAGSHNVRACAPTYLANIAQSPSVGEPSQSPARTLVSKQFLYYPRALLVRLVLVLLLVAPGLRRRRVRASSLLLDVPQPRRLGAQFCNLVPQDAVLGLVGLPT